MPAVHNQYLIYHQIEPEAHDYRYQLSLQEFQAHLTLAIEIAGAADTEVSLPRFTFDDGHRSHYLHVFPLLAKHRIAGIFFVTAGWIEQRAEYMTWAQVRELSDGGHQLGSHGLSHQMLTHCSASELAEELVRSREILEQKIGLPIERVSLPGGRWNARVLKACATAGYKHVFTSDPGTPARRLPGVETIGRINMTQGISPGRLRDLLDCRSGALRRYRLLSTAKNFCRAIVGDNLYHQLWRLVSGSGNAD
jgi:hypothetical protein